MNKEVSMVGANIRAKKGDPRRRLKDKLARLLVTGGGVLVLGALLLIFIFLSFVIYPLFERPDISLLGRFNEEVKASALSTPLAMDEVVAMGLDGKNNYLYQFFQEGNLRVLPISPQNNIKNQNIGSALNQAMPIQLMTRPNLLQQKLVQAPTSFAASFEHDLFAYGTQDGEVIFFQLSFGKSDKEGQSLPLISSPKKLLLSEYPIEQLAIAKTQTHQLIASIFDNKLQLIWSLNDAQSAPLYLYFPKGDAQQLEVSKDGRFVYLLNDKKLFIYTELAQKWQLRQTIDIEKITGQKPISLALLSGGSSLLIRLSDGRLTQWFDVNEKQHASLRLIRYFDADEGFLAAEKNRNVFLNLDQKGEAKLWHISYPKADQYTLPLWHSPLNGLAFSDDGTRLIVSQKEGISLFELDNPHPEINLHALWQQIWYEGYDKGEYVWQSSSSRDDMEGKFSVMPLVFGSLKVAVYTLIFSIPLALGSAIYTAYFMPLKLRRVVKPVIEMMEALPTVILGFIAAVWFAPLLEQHLTFGLTFIIAMPVLFLIIGFMWSKLPLRWRSPLPQSGHLALLIPLILLLSYLLYRCEPYLESVLFSGDAPLFLSEIMGIRYEQRNAIVVGLAMGFAVIPTIFTLAEEAIFSVPKHLTKGSLALGATHWQTLSRVVLLTASPGIFSAVMMGLGRAMGETMIVLMATGNTPLMEWNMFEGLRSLSANIAIEMPESQVGSSHYRVLFLTGFLLFSFTFVFNTLAEYIRQQLRDKYRTL